VLATLINRKALEALSGGTAFHRGEEYFAVGAVGRLRVQENKVSAKVEGTETYQVELWEEDGELAGEAVQSGFFDAVLPAPTFEVDVVRRAVAVDFEATISAKRTQRANDEQEKPLAAYHAEELARHREPGLVG
jgi:hypothetical protein